MKLAAIIVALSEMSAAYFCAARASHALVNQCHCKLAARSEAADGLPPAVGIALQGDE